MFVEGDYVIYGSNGVCRVEGAGTLDVEGVPKDRLYYTLTPVYIRGSKIFIPVDKAANSLRPVITSEEAWSLINNINEIELQWVSDAKKREVFYKEILRKNDCRELVGVIKILYCKHELSNEGKKVTARDDKYCHLAEENLYRELAIPLGIDKDKVKEVIEKSVMTH